MIELTQQSIDQASRRVLLLWKASRLKNVSNSGEDEGIYSWLIRVSNEALSKGEKLESGKYRYNGMKLMLVPHTVMDHISGCEIRRYHSLISIERMR